MVKENSAKNRTLVVQVSLCRVVTGNGYRVTKKAITGAASFVFAKRTRYTTKSIKVIYVW